MRTAAERAVDTLAAHHSTAGEIPAEIFGAQASASGYSVRQLKRLVELRLADKPLWTEPTFTVTEQIITAVFLACGCLAQAHRLLQRHGVKVPPETTFK